MLRSDGCWLYERKSMARCHDAVCANRLCASAGVQGDGCLQSADACAGAGDGRVAQGILDDLVCADVLDAR